MNEKTIGLNGPSGVGKDSFVVAVQLGGDATAGSPRILHSKMALGLRALVYNIYPALDKTMMGDREYEEAHGVRKLMIEVAKKTLNYDSKIWVDVEIVLRARFLKGLPPKDTITMISDVRFPRQVRSIESKGGIVVGLSRNGIKPNPRHLDGLICPTVNVMLNDQMTTDWAYAKAFAISQKAKESDCRRRTPDYDQVIKKLKRAIDRDYQGAGVLPVLQLAEFYLQSLNRQLLSNEIK